MSTLLKIDVSPRGDHSISRALGAKFASDWQSKHSGGTIQTRDLASTSMPFVDLPWILSSYTPEEARTPDHKQALKLSDDFIAEIKKADEILLTTPMYNFGVPAALKAWIDHIVRAGVTFRANPDGSYTGLLENKKVTVIIASAGSYTPGTPGETYNAERPYLKQIFGFVGLTNVGFVEAGSTFQVDRGMKSREDYLSALNGEVSAAAAR